MASERQLRQLEDSIRKKMHRIKMGTLTPKESKIGVEINLMKSFDEILHKRLMDEYKNIMKNK